MTDMPAIGYLSDDARTGGDRSSRNW